MIACSRWLCSGVAGLLSSATLLHGAASAVRPEFNRSIRPLLSENCFACHGPDNRARKAGLRLDTKDGIFEKTAKHEPAVVPGSLEKSELWRRLTATDPDEKMPPPESHKTLKPEQKELFKRWILAGAPWQGHWAYLKPERPPVPKVTGAGFKVRNPIDALVLTKLQSKGLKPNSEADRRALGRRVFLDLTGLPPKPEVVEGFVKDRSANAYEKLVKQAMDSPAWGEHRARYWLDAARYADTHGLHFDNYREMWPYRDWVIKAFNSNLRFNQFTIDQIAGDLLADPTDDQEVASGFQRCNMTTNEGGTIEEENLVNYANDRVTTTGWVFLGSTLNCCACHDHKFDPFTQQDFYSMAAFYRNTTQSGFDKNIHESDVFKVVPPTAEEQARWKALPGEIEQTREARDAQARQAEGALTNWLATLDLDHAKAPIPQLTASYLQVPLNEGGGTNVAAQIENASVQLSSPVSVVWTTNLGPFGPAPVLTKEKSLLLGDRGDFEANEPFSLGAWVLAPKDFKGEGSVLARMGGEGEKYRGWDLVLRQGDFALLLVNRWSNIALETKSTGAPVALGEWQHLFVTYDGTGRGKGVKLFVNGIEVPTNRDRNGLEGSIRSPFPLRIGRRERDHQLDQVAVQDVRIYRTRLSTNEVRALAAAPRLSTLLAQWRQAPPPAETTEAQEKATPNPAATESSKAATEQAGPGEKAGAEKEKKEKPNQAAEKAAAKAKAERERLHDALRDYFLVTQHQGWQEAQRKLAALESEQALIRGHSPATLVQVEKKSEPMAAILFRGQYDKPREKVSPATPAVLHPLPANAPKNRLTLAQWLVSRENPLTARVTVNRFWQEIFGVGLVKNVDDFGTTSEPPANQELLDWLAVEFVESGWDVKHLFALIVTSSTYRQSAEVTPEKLQKDPQNRFCSRGPRFRMDAEMLRDSALAVSGLLVEKTGGPSVRPYQPDGVWEAVAMPESNTRYYQRDQGPALYRRSLYTFWKRAAPPPTMDIFNAPSREVCTVRRERTNTPLQALATLNDPQFVEAARHLAEAALLQGRGNEEKTIREMALRLLSRPLKAKEQAIVSATLKAMQTYYEAEPEAARQLLATGDSKSTTQIDAPRLAAMTMVANQLMNLDETLNK